MAPRLHLVTAMNRGLKLLNLLAGLTLIIATSACEAPDSPATAPDTPNTNAAAITPVKGQTAFANGCPFGSQENFRPASLELWNCPIGLDTLELKQDFQKILLQVDCKKNVVIVRNEARTLDSSWEVLPNGKFDFTVDGGIGQFASDGSGKHTDCSVPMMVDVSGQLDCKNRDQVNYQVETVWTAAPDTDVRWKTITTKCTLPPSCYLYSTAPMKQCS